MNETYAGKMRAILAGNCQSQRTRRMVNVIQCRATGLYFLSFNDRMHTYAPAAYEMVRECWHCDWKRVAWRDGGG